MEIDLLSEVSYAGGHPAEQYAWLREHAPIHRHAEPDGPGFWAVTSYDLVKEVGRDATRFSSHPTIMIPGPTDGASSAMASGDHTMMLVADPPLHTRMRRLVSREFTPRAAAALRPRIAELATQIVDDVIERGACDLVHDIAGAMPSYVIADILGIPLEDGVALYASTEKVHSTVISDDEREAAVGEIFLRSQEVYEEKTTNPGDDLATLIVRGEVDGKPVDSIDFFLWFMLLIDAGGDTTRNLVGGAMHALLQRPDQYARLRADVDGLLPSAIEEFLRWVSPVIYMRRTATCDTTLAGTAIARGDKVVMYYGAANRDPAHFANAETLDIARSPNAHVAFGGGGPHYCLGAAVARVELEELFREMLVRLDGVELAGEVTWMGSNFIYGPTSMPITFATQPTNT